MEVSSKRAAKDEVSFIFGNRYVFSYQHNRVELWTSSFTGKEVVKVNGKVVGQTRSYRKVSQHRFHVAGQPLMLEINVASILKGPVFCVLHERDRAGVWQPVAAKKLVAWPPDDESLNEDEKPSKSSRSRVSWWLQFGFFFALGVILSRAVGFNTWQFWGTIAAFVGLLTLLEHFFKRRKTTTSNQDVHSLGMYIEDISIEQIGAERSSGTSSVLKS